MADACGMLYTNSDKKCTGGLRDRLTSALFFNNTHNFVQCMKRDFGVTFRTSPDEGDSEADIRQSRKEFLEDLDYYATLYKNSLSDSGKKAAVDTVLETIKNALDLTDGTQVSDTETTVNPEPEVTPKYSERKFGSLDKFMEGLYGKASSDMQTSLGITFEDRIIRAAYYDIDSGDVRMEDDATLNRNIRELKAQLFSTLVHYLKQENLPGANTLSDAMYDKNGRLDVDNYYRARGMFYSHYSKNRKNFQDKLVSANSNRIAGTDRTAKAKIYKALVEELLANDPVFAKRMANTFGERHFKLMSDRLYTADHFSLQYAAVKTFIEKNGQTAGVNARKSPYVSEHHDELMARINLIEEPELNALTAADAYAMLAQFDNLMDKYFRGQIEMTKYSKGFEDIGTDKYSYVADQSRHGKNFSDTDDFSTESNTPQFTKAVIHSVRLYDYVTGEYKNRRLDVTALVVAASRLMAAVRTNSLTFINSSNNGVKASINTLKECVLKFHENPVENLQKMLETLFEHPKNEDHPLVELIEGGLRVVGSENINVLKSIYDQFFNKNSSRSLWSKFVRSYRQGSLGAATLINEIAGFFDRNTDNPYLETLVDYYTGKTYVRTKKVFFNNIELKNLISRTNRAANRTTKESIDALQKAYRMRYDPDNLTVTRGKDQKLISYSVTIGANENGEGGTTVSLIVPSTFSPLLMGVNPESGTKMKIVCSDEGFLDRLESIDLVMFRRKLETDAALLTDDEKSLKQVLQFLDDTLGLNILAANGIGLQTLQTYKSLYSPIEGMKTFLEPFLKLGIRSAYGNLKRQEAASQKQSLAKYLEASKDTIYDTFVGNAGSKLFSDRFHDLRYAVASYADEVLSLWTDARSLLEGKGSSPTTKNWEGDQISNTSVSKLGTNIHYYLTKQHGTPTEDLMFVQERDLLRSISQDLEVTTMYDDKKSVKRFSSKELFFHSIFEKFWGSYLQTRNPSTHEGNIVVQATAYADKTVFLNYECKAKFDKVNLMTASEDELIETYMGTIGKAYKKIYDNHLERMGRIVNELVAEGVIAQPPVTEYIGKTLSKVTKDQFLHAASAIGVGVGINDYHTVTINGEERVALNEMLAHNSELYNSASMLREELETQKTTFVNDMIRNLCSFQVITGNDVRKMFEGHTVNPNYKSKNQILRIILDVFTAEERINYVQNWIDEDSGKLIIAKQYKDDGTAVNIISVGDKYDKKGRVVLNPLFNRYFYVEGLMSNNLRASLSGFETNHPAGKNTPFSRAKSVKTFVDWNKLGYGPKFLTEAEFAELKGLLDSSPSVDILEANIEDEMTNLESAMEGVPGLSEKTMEGLSAMLKAHYAYVTSTSQGTQFKRNNIIPATLQYCTQNLKDGVASKIKVAVIDDLQAPVFNVRGDHEGTIDSHDGGAWVTPFEALLENKSLGTHAVGNTRKLIIHDYDRDNATAFQAKFAAYAMTNELMAHSSDPASVSLFRLFKRMTNLQWTPEDRVDLLKGLLETQSFSGDNTAEGRTETLRWFRSVILENKRLFYLNGHKEVVEIAGFNRDGDTGIYYTEEKAPGENSLTRVYHIFYDREGPNGKSAHFFGSMNEVQQFCESLEEHGQGWHTINSLFELHTALGSVSCCDESGKQSEFNNRVVVNFMNNVGELRDPKMRDEVVTQRTYNQPLKDKQICYAFTQTSIKVGAKNVNSSAAWSNDDDLMYFDMNTDGMGTQLNYEEEISEDDVAEFSQVIAATAAYGWTNENCSELFYARGKAMVEGSKVLLDSVDNYLNTLSSENVDPEVLSKARSDLYDAIGRIISVNYRIKREQNLMSVVMEAVQSVFGKYHNHTNDVLKYAYSDPNMYTSFISTLASTITTESVKLRHPGSGTVMSPAYGIIQMYEVPNENGSIEKLSSSNVVTRAYEDYRNGLINYIAGVAPTSGEVTIRKYNERYAKIAAQTTAVLERTAIAKWNRLNPDTPLDPEIFRYYTEDRDLVARDLFMLNTYLKKHEQYAEMRADKSYFVPSDIVEIIGADGEVKETVNLMDLGLYYNFKDRDYNAVYGPGVQFRNSVVRPYDLRPTLIRWQYVDSDGVTKWMNLFDVDTIRNAYINDTERDNNYRTEIQDVLHDLDAGYFYRTAVNPATGEPLIDVETKQPLREQVFIVEGSLNKEDFELITGNLYKDTFDLGDESLADILRQGEEYFYKRLKRHLPPANGLYDVAMLTGGGKHVLLTTSQVTEIPELVVEKPFEKNTVENANGEVRLLRGGRPLYEIGRWMDVDDVIFNEKAGEQGQFEGTAKRRAPINQDKFRNVDGRVQEYIDFVRRYDVVTKLKNNDGTEYFQTNTLYQIINDHALARVFGSKPGDLRDAHAKQANLIKKIYMSNGCTLVQLNAYKNWSDDKIKSLRSALAGITGDNDIDGAVRELITTQLDSYSPVDIDNMKVDRSGTAAAQRHNRDLNEKRGLAKKANKQAAKDALEAYMRKIAHEKWVSFQDSRKFISSRIPAQTLQSFMAMKMVGWMQNGLNISYVSHFQTYLQGSDYDIDKAYLMGQSYDQNGRYVRWSPLFDYSTQLTLEESKRLPVPRDLKVFDSSGENVKQGVDLTAVIDTICDVAEVDGKSGRLTTEGKTEGEKVRYLRAMRTALRAIIGTKGAYYYNGTPAKDDSKTAKLIAFRNTLKAHEEYKVPDKYAEAAYKNVTSANVYMVASDIRNLDQAMTAVTMKDMRAAAAQTPKGRQESTMNMLNPLTKYLMQYENMSGKNVTGIAANGEKFWFAAYYYMDNAFRNGTEDDRRRIRFCQKLTRINGRAKGTKFDPATAVRTHAFIPDLDRRNEKIRTALESLMTDLAEMGIDVYDPGMKYVDQKISQFLSAATDNAKELILAKVNAGANFAKMYLYLCMMGYDANDVAAFMSCPISEFISTIAEPDIYQHEFSHIQPWQAINMAKGFVSASTFLHGNYVQYVMSETGEGFVRETMNKIKYMYNALSRVYDNADFADVALLELGKARTADGNLPKLSTNEMMQGLILTAVHHPELLWDSELGAASLYTVLTKTRDVEINSYLRFCQDLIVMLTNVKEQYNIEAESDPMTSFMRDVEEFDKVFHLADEMSGISASLLALNQGFPTDKVKQIRLLGNIRKIVTERERVFNIRRSALYPPKEGEEAVTEEPEAGEEQENKTEKDYTAEWSRLTTAIFENNPALPRNTDVRKIFDKADKYGIIGGFDVYKMLTDEGYREAARDYLDLIKGTVNGIDMVYSIPHYRQIMECFKANLVAERTSSAKSRLLLELEKSTVRSMTNPQLRGMTKYADNVLVRHYLKNTLKTFSITGSAMQSVDENGNPVDLSVIGFNMAFSAENAVTFDLSTQHGAAGFIRFCTNEFLDWLRLHYGNNKFVQHLITTEEDGKTILTVDVDLMNPNLTAVTRQAYQDIEIGLSELSSKKFKNDGSLMISDVLELYNLIQNSNRYGSERLTTAFEVCLNKNDLLSRYYASIGELDYDITKLPEYNKDDFWIAVAPVISEASERFHNEPFVKVKDNIWGYVVKYYDKQNNEYKPYEMMPALIDKYDTQENNDIRKINYAMYCPFEMPNYAGVHKISESIVFSGKPNEGVIEQIRVLLNDMSISGKIMLILDNC